jgi:hypothetical protein
MPKFNEQQRVIKMDAIEFITTSIETGVAQIALELAKNRLFLECSTMRYAVNTYIHNIKQISQTLLEKQK